MCFVHPKTNKTHGNHSQDIEPSALEPLPKRRTLVVVTRGMAMMIRFLPTVAVPEESSPLPCCCCGVVVDRRIGSGGGITTRAVARKHAHF